MSERLSGLLGKPWSVVWLSFSIAVFSWSVAFYGASLYIAQMTRIDELSVADVSAGVSAMYVLSALLTLYTGDLLARFGHRLVVCSALTFLGAGLVCIGAVVSSWQAYAAFLLLGVGWAFTGSATVNTVLARWFEEKRGLALSVALTGATLAGLISVPLWSLLSARFTFGASTQFLALALVVLVPLAAWVLPGRGRADVTTARSSVTSGAPASYTFANIIRTSRFWWITGPFALGLFAQVGLVSHQLSYVETRIGPDHAAYVMSVMSGAAIVGRLLYGVLTSHVGNYLLGAINFAVQATGVGVLVLFDAMSAIYAGFLLFGFGVGNTITLPGLLVGQEFDSVSFGRAVSMNVSFGQLTYAFGPVAIGVLASTFSSYSPALFMCFVLQSGCAVTLLLRHRFSRQGRAIEPGR